MSIIDTIRNGLRSWIMTGDVDEEVRKRKERLILYQEYYEGNHIRQLRVKPGKYDDNLAINIVGLIADKAVSALVGDPADGQGLTWTFESETVDATPPQIEWLNAQWEANHQQIFLHKNALQGAESGIPAVKTVPDGAGNIRLVNINPLTLTVDTDAQDVETPTAYHIEYNTIENDRQVAHREDTIPNNDTSWLVNTMKQIGDKWEQVGPSVLWPYPFPPLLVWQNLPALDCVYGRSDIENIIPIQDKLNFHVANCSKMSRLFATPQRYGKNLSQQIEVDQNTGRKTLQSGPDEMWMFQGGADSEIVQLPPAGDIPGLIALIGMLREFMFMTAREIDIALIKDKAGALTNFNMKALYRDFLDKLGTKRMLYGDAYTELNRRMLILGGYAGEECVINWPDPLPVNTVEETASVQSALNMGLISKQTAADELGYDWEQESKRMSEEATASQNAGSVLLNTFLKTGGAQPTRQPANVGTAV
jgi:hypothetical protein